MQNDDMHINLPSTPFPMEARLRERVQPEMLQKWRAMDIYKTILEDRRNADAFVLHDGPPYASGDTHIGIGFNKILKDIIVKHWAMRGKRVPFVPGWDCHGLPIEAEVRREFSDQHKSPSLMEVRERCASHASRYIQEQQELFQQLGVFADWNRPYRTMDHSYEAGVLEILSEIVRKGYVYLGVRPVYWCPTCKTVLADAEVEPATASRAAAWVRFVVDETSAGGLGVGNRRVSLLASVKEIWALASCVGVSVEPGTKYVLMEQPDGDGRPEVFVVKEDAAEQASVRLGIGPDATLKQVTADDLRGLTVKHPVTLRQIPVIACRAAERRSETGVAAVAPAHYFDDFQLALDSGLDVPALIDESGSFTPEAGDGLGGLSIHDAQTVLLGQMRAAGTLAQEILADERAEAQGVRCGHTLIVRATEQWFVSLDHKEAGSDKTLRERALDEVDNLVRWIPSEQPPQPAGGEGGAAHAAGRAQDGSAFNKARLLNMIKARPDWCISRQRDWGVPIPALACNGCGEVILDPGVIQKVRDIVASEGSDAWYTVGLEDVIPNDFTCRSCGGSAFEKHKGQSVLDVWFESSTSWYSALVADSRLSFPAALCVEGNDQHRGWFQLSLLTSIMVRGKAPYTTLLTHGFVLDKQRRKMSKSLRNFVTLKSAVEGNEGAPADLVRLYFVWNKNITQDLPLSIRDILELQPVYLTFRNCFKYLLGNLNDYAPSEAAVPLSELHNIDKWILSRLYSAVEEVTEAYETYNFQKAIGRLYEFCNNDLSRTYFEAVKDRLYSEGAKSVERRSVQTTLHSILIALVKMLAPILVYTCEEVWSFCPGIADCASVHLSMWPDKRGGVVDPGGQVVRVYEQMAKLRRALQPEFERARQAGIIGSTIEASLTVCLDPSPGASGVPLQGSSKELREFLTVSEIKVVTAADGLKELPEFPGVRFFIERCPHPRCLRCRQYDATVGDDALQPSLCARCVQVLEVARQHKNSIPEFPIGSGMRPAVLAAYMKARGIRKVAILNVEGRCTPYYFQRPSQEVVPHPGLQPLADYIQNHPDFKNHAAILLGLGDHTDVLFGIGIHSLDRGTPLGGTREFTYGSVGELLENLLRLSYAMTVKNTIGDLPHGGGKSIIDTCELDLKIHRELRRRIYRDFGQFNATLFGRYICAEDIGNTTEDTRQMLSSCRHVMCLPEGVGGSGNPSRFTALVGWLAARAGWESLTGSNSLDGLTIAIQGAGQVGQHFVDILTEGRPGRILIADKDQVQIDNMRKLLHRKGQSHLLEERGWQDTLTSMKEKTGAPQSGLSQATSEASDYILYSECDILVCVAVGKVVYPENVPFLKCKLIVPIANNTYSDNDLVARKIWERGIVDVVESNVNWGGAAVAASELYGYDEDYVIKWCLGKAYKETRTLLEQARELGVPPWDVLKERAESEMKKAHPIVEAARRYSFIGKMNENLADWIKTKWLPSISGVDADVYAGYVVKLANSAADSNFDSV